MRHLATVILVLLSFSLQAQTIFYIGDDSVSVKEFLKAYHKNNTATKTEKAFRDYLSLYISSRLKIREAEERGYDTLPQIKADLDNLRQQILPAYLTDKEGVNRLIKEVLSRSKKNIHLAHIFISFSQNGVVDTMAATKKLEMVLAQLKQPVSFAAVARRFSDDPSAKSNGGDLDWIAVLTLPYALENLAFQTAPGQLSTVYRSKVGFHLLKNLGERADPGRMKAAQILVAYQPDADDVSKKVMKMLADSLYDRVKKGDDFGKLATLYSNDVISAAAGGQMQEFGVGQYDPVFEKNAFSLLKDGAISQPFVTSYGYHIIKRLSRTSKAWNEKDPKSMELLRSQIEQSDRMSTTKKALAEKIIRKAGTKKAFFNDQELWAFSDSIMNYTKGQRQGNITYASPLLNIGDKTFTVTDWISYAQTFRYKPDGSGVKPYPQVWDEFVEAMAITYYQDHLESFNEDFRQQVNEFRDGNLFFEIMQRQVWGPAQSDSAALLDFYNKNKNRYRWPKSAGALMFYASDMSMAKEISAAIKKSPASWREIVNQFNEKITVDSGRFELDQIPNPTKLVLKPGTTTAPLVNKGDQTASFAYVLRAYEKGGQRSFAEARGLVINDYQLLLEKIWLASLEKKYPVRVNERVMEDLVRNKK